MWEPAGAVALSIFLTCTLFFVIYGLAYLGTMSIIVAIKSIKKSINKKEIQWTLIAGVAQLVEHHVANVKVVSSNLITRFSSGDIMKFLSSPNMSLFCGLLNGMLTFQAFSAGNWLMCLICFALCCYCTNNYLKGISWLELFYCQQSLHVHRMFQ